MSDKPGRNFVGLMRSEVRELHRGGLASLPMLQDVAEQFTVGDIITGVADCGRYQIRVVKVMPRNPARVCQDLIVELAKEQP